MTAPATVPAADRPKPPALRHHAPTCPMCGTTVGWDDGWECGPCGAWWSSELGTDDDEGMWADEDADGCGAVCPRSEDRDLVCVLAAEHDGRHRPGRLDTFGWEGDARVPPPEPAPVDVPRLLAATRDRFHQAAQRGATSACFVVAADVRAALAALADHDDDGYAPADGDPQRWDRLHGCPLLVEDDLTPGTWRLETEGEG